MPKQLPEGMHPYAPYVLGFLVFAGLAVLLFFAARAVMRSPFYYLYQHDYFFKCRVVLYSGTLFNAGYAAIKLFSGITLDSVWLTAIGVYYLTLTLVRFDLVRQDIIQLRSSRADSDTGWKACVRTGYLMLLVNTGLIAIIMLVVNEGWSFSFPGVLIYFTAAHTFYRLYVAFAEMFRSRKAANPLFIAAKAVDFSFALASMFTLQTAMLSVFSPDMDARRWNLIGGAAVSILNLLIAAFLVIRGNRNLKLKAA